MTMRPVPRSKKVWHALRAKHVTASEIAPLLGMGAKYQQSPFALFHIKAGTVPPPAFENNRMEAGNALETAIARWAARREGWKIRRGCFAIDDTIEGASATLDFIIESSDALAARGFDGPGALEIKNVDRWEYEEKWEGDEPPPHIALQHQQQLACTGWFWGAVAVCVGGNVLEVIYYHARPGIIANIRETITEFWRRVAASEPYPVDHFESTADVLKAMYKPREDDHCDWSESEEARALAEEFRLLDERLKDGGKRLEHIKAQFRERLGNNKSAGFEGFRVSRSVGANTPSRIALPGEVIPGRKGQDRLTISFPVAKAKGKAVANTDAPEQQVAA